MAEGNNAGVTYNFLSPPDYDKEGNVNGIHKEENVVIDKNDLNYFFANKMIASFS